MSARRVVFLDMGASGPRARGGGALWGALSARGFEVARVHDAQGVLDALVELSADLLIIDADSPALQLRELVESVRKDPRHARMLVVVLSSADPRELPARKEIALILAKPIQPEEAASRLESLVVARQKAGTSTSELRGDLGQLPLPDLLQLLSVSRASGVLSVDAPGKRGSIILDGGELRLVSLGPATGIKAFVRLLMIESGGFVFTHGALDPNAITGEVLGLGPALFEATRHIDELTRMRLSPKEPWVEVRRNKQPYSAEMRTRIENSKVHAEIARLVDTPRTLGALLDASPFSDLELLEALETFRDEGFIEITSGTDGNRIIVLDAAYAGMIAARLGEIDRTTARLLILIDNGPSSGESVLVRALGQIAGFVPTEHNRPSTPQLGPVGVISLGTTRLELFAVPAEREVLPLWGVFAPRSDAVVVAATMHDGLAEERAVAAELSLPMVSVRGALTPDTLGEALRQAIAQITARK